MQSTSQPGVAINVDWEVIETNGTAFGALYPNDFVYLYQIENSTTAVVDIFSVTLPLNTINTVVTAGVLSLDNLDVASAYHPSHVPATFPSLAGENDAFGFEEVFTTADIDVSNRNITWTAPQNVVLNAGMQSNTLYFISTLPPIYGNAVAQDSIPPSPWITIATPITPLAQQVPVPDPDGMPIPEPSTLVLGAIASLALVGWRHRHARMRRRRVAWKDLD